MKEKTNKLDGAIIQEVKLITDYDETKYCPYKLSIKTDKGTLVFEGEHDIQGSLVVDGKEVGQCDDKDTSLA